MKMFLAGVLFIGLPLPGYSSDLCDDLWFSRNLVFDKVGYCFGSALGQAVFNNEGCTTTSPVLSANERAFVAWVKQTEQDWECRVDTSRTQLTIENIDTRRQLIDPVAASPFESACIGYIGGPLRLYAGHDTRHPVIGYADPGGNVHWAHEWLDAPEGWSFVTVKLRNGLTMDMGWTNAYFGPETCEALAG